MTQTIVFTGFFVFAVIIGIISDEIATKVRVARFPNPGTLFADCPEYNVCPYIAQFKTDPFFYYRKVEEVKTGNNKVIETDHTVVVNWNSQLVPLLKQMAVAKSERAGTFDKPVVLLADIDKETMDDLVANALEDSPPLEVVTRRGTALGLSPNPASLFCLLSARNYSYSWPERLTLLFYNHRKPV